ncbi:MAG: replication-associated recombination protein A [Phycisphaerales bacterium]
MADLFAARRAEALARAQPLALRMRPRTLDEFAGQSHILGEGKLLRRLIASGRFTSLVFFGPPGTGKTTLAELVATATDRHFEKEIAASVGVARIREIIEAAARRLADTGRRTVLFLDEIHRFSRSQQDVLLGDVERGVLSLIGATTENPLFAINAALISRSTLFRLEPLTEDEILTLLERAATDRERGVAAAGLTITRSAMALWARACDGDARRALTAMEVAVLSAAPAGTSGSVIDDAVARESIQQKMAVYGDDEHFDSASAIIKSIRGSDPQSAVYWLARMLEGGEDPRFIARRLAILASEDIGNADPRAIMIAEAAWSLVERIGLPEARITLAQCVTYLALAPKSNAAYVAIEEALKDVREGRTIAVPSAIKDGMVKKSIRVSEGAGPGESYRYAHDQTANTSIGAVTGQADLGRTYYRPTDRGAERILADRLTEVEQARAALRARPEPQPRPDH